MTQVFIAGGAGFATATAGYLALLLLLFAAPGKSLQRRLLILASAVSLLWGLGLTIQMWKQLPLTAVFALDSARNFSWLLLILSAFSDRLDLKTLFQERCIPATFLLLPIVTGLFELYLFFSAATNYQLLIFGSHLAQTISMLWLLEQLFRRTDNELRWYIKPFCLAIGMVYAYDFVLFADAVLIRTIKLEFWLGRGWVALFALPLLLISLRRLKHWGTQIYVSRTIIFQSTLLFAAAIYLLVMALAGYYIRFVGGNWGNLVQVLFFLLGGLLLAALFLSDNLRSRVRVAITKHFFANRYGYREEWLKLADWLDDDNHPVFENALNALRSPFESKRALLALREPAGRFRIKATHNASTDNPTTAAILQELAEFALEHDWIIDLQELATQPKRYPFSFSAQRAEQLGQSFRMLVPIQSNHGLQAICLLAFADEDKAIDYEDRDLMKVIGRQLSIYLHLHHTSQQLSDSQQFDAFNRMSAFLLHDLKNVQAQLQLIIKNAEQHRDNPEFIDDTFDTVGSACLRLGKVLEQLSNKQAIHQQQQLVELEECLQEVCQTRQVAIPHPVINATAKIQIKTNRERLKAVLSHLVSNAQEATADAGVVELSLSHAGQFAKLTIHDTGCGMTAEFIETRLFKPFDTTKGNAGMGVGAYDAKKFAEDGGGFVEVSSTPGEGTNFSLYLPI